MSLGREMLRHWDLDPSITYLNHGTVGVTPRRVLLRQQQIREEIERQPSKFLLRDYSGLVGLPRGEPPLVRQAAAIVAAFVNADAQDVVFVDNATTGVNAVLRSVAIDAGDEILLTDHNYGATAKVAAFVARQRRAELRTVRVPYPGFTAQALLEAIARAITTRTRIAVIDHITSESALLFPLKAIVDLCRARGVPVLVDGAHAPGVVPVDLQTLGAHYYTANLHKWAHAPRGCGFLWARRDRQIDLHPPVISWGLDQGYTAEFDWVGTRDPSAWLAAPEGISFVHELGIDAVWRYNHALAWRAARLLTERWGTQLPCAEHDVAFMATVPLPDALGRTAGDAAAVRDALLFEDRIEVQVHAAHGQLWARVSAQVYLELSDVERLASAVERLASAR
jgi:isopenicillin-N epimerase